MAHFLAREAGLSASKQNTSSPGSARFWISMISLGTIGAVFGWLVGSAFFSDQQLLAPGWQLVLVVVGFLLFWLPLHEAIHALFFKLLGAPQVGFGYARKGMMVYAYAQRFVMTLRENALVAAMPFLINTILLIILIIRVPGLQLVWGLTLLLHTLGCVGDFILVLYAWKNRHRTIHTYDDLEEKRTYFFEKQ
jgi:hypothetical protein